jgi:hypothetical protein
MSEPAPAVCAVERRRRSRLAAADLEVIVRVKGKLRGLRVPAMDFNRHGIALALSTIVAKDTEVRLSLRMGDRRADDVLGIVHNCIAQGDQYRCGIQFRTASASQFDRHAVEATLRSIERALDT